MSYLLFYESKINHNYFSIIIKMTRICMFTGNRKPLFLSQLAAAVPSSSLVLLLVISQLTSSTISTISSPSPSSSECGMYLAPSTIPGAGMGVFAGHHDIRQGEYLLSDDGDLVIPAYEMNWHVGLDKRYSFLWEEYTWKVSRLRSHSHSHTQLK
ncbi:MAG: hypothetical protein ACI8RD_011136 [Bacillariaceae sp.]|jgi:hypothetical protein